jgi:hypothetical protein
MFTLSASFRLVADSDKMLLRNWMFIQQSLLTNGNNNAVWSGLAHGSFITQQCVSSPLDRHLVGRALVIADFVGV